MPIDRPARAMPTQPTPAMTREEARDALTSANRAIAAAAMMLTLNRPIMDQLLAEDSRADSIMPIVDPTLWMNRERQAVAAGLVPLYRAALVFLDAVEVARVKVVDPALAQGAF